MTNMPQPASKKVPQPNKRFRKRKRAEPVQNAVAEEPKLPPSTRMSDEAPPKRVRQPNRMLNVTCLCLRFLRFDGQTSRGCWCSLREASPTNSGT